MDISKLSHGAKVVLVAGIVFLITSFFNWFEVKDTSYGISMWHGIGFLAGLILLALIVWQGIRLANINLEIGVTPSMITAALAILLLVFTFIRFISKPGKRARRLPCRPDVLGLARVAPGDHHRRGRLDEHAGRRRGPQRRAEQGAVDDERRRRERTGRACRPNTSGKPAAGPGTTSAGGPRSSGQRPARSRLIDPVRAASSPAHGEDAARYTRARG